MTGAMYAAIGGLKTHMASLNVIGNNIANVNTVGYKAQRMTFRESLYTMSRAGSNGTLVLGGNNPSQVGYGSQVGSIDLNMSPGTFSPTGLDLDCMIEGDGFFMVGDKDMEFNSGSDFTRATLTRVGDFWQDANGYICNRDGQVVYGFKTIRNPFYVGNLPGNPPSNEDIKKAEDLAKAMKVDPKLEYIVSSELVPLRVPLAAAQPTEANGGIVDGEEVWKAGEPVYDLMGGLDPKTGLRKNYSWIDPETGKLWDDIQKQLAGTTAGGGTGGGTGGAPGPGQVTLTDPNAGTATGVAGGGTGGGTGGANSQYYEFGVGNPAPNAEGTHTTLDGLKVTEEGTIVGTSAVTGDTVVIGYIAIAKVAAPDGVTHIGGPYYKCQEGAGDITVGAVGGIMDGRYLNNEIPVDRATGQIPDEVTDNRQIVNSLSPLNGTGLRSGGLEASTADVATEFSNMILTQRGYQANTRIVTVTDSMLEELVNMKR